MYSSVNLPGYTLWLQLKNNLPLNLSQCGFARALLIPVAVYGGFLAHEVESHPGDRVTADYWIDAGAAPA